MDNILISLKELAALFGMQTPAARRITQSPHFPSVIVLPGGTLRWYRQEVLDWLSMQQRPSHTIDLGQATPKKPRPGLSKARRAQLPSKPDPVVERHIKRALERRNERSQKAA